MEKPTNADTGAGFPAGPPSSTMPEKNTIHQQESDLDALQMTKLEPESDTPLDDTPIYVTGFKLALVVACLAMACFLVLMDTMIISTVSC